MSVDQAPEGVWVYGWVTAAGVRYRATKYTGPSQFWLKDGDVRRAARVYSEDSMELLCGPKVAATFQEGQ